jgi:hypothetical protein
MREFQSGLGRYEQSDTVLVVWMLLIGESVLLDKVLKPRGFIVGETVSSML